MSLETTYDLTPLVNQMERQVFEELEKQLDAIPDGDICKCNDCVLDMACMALNKLPPWYRVSLMGSLFSELESGKIQKQVAEKVAAAIEKISLNPLCGNLP